MFCSYHDVIHKTHVVDKQVQVPPLLERQQRRVDVTPVAATQSPATAHGPVSPVMSAKQCWERMLVQLI